MIYLLLEIDLNHIFFGKIIFIKNPLCFRIYILFEADNEKDDASLGNKKLLFKNKIQYLMVIV